MARDKETFLARWSRVKREQDLPQKDEKEAEDAKEAAPPPALPPVESLTPESDFSPFMHPKVEETLRRVALKKLFSDPRFNVPDPFEAYSGDWTGGEPISQEMLATLNQARTLLFDKENAQKEDTTARETTAQEKTAQEKTQLENTVEKPRDDEPGRQDT